MITYGWNVDRGLCSPAQQTTPGNLQRPHPELLPQWPLSVVENLYKTNLSYIQEDEQAKMSEASCTILRQETFQLAKTSKRNVAQDEGLDFKVM